MAKDNLRQVRYDVAGRAGSEFPYTWTILAINGKREIGDIKQKSQRILASCGDFYLGAERELPLAEGPIPGTDGLQYSAFEILTHRGRISPKEQDLIYAVREKFTRDRRLNRRPEGQAMDVWFQNIVVPAITGIQPIVPGKQ